MMYSGLSIANAGIACQMALLVSSRPSLQALCSLNWRVGPCNAADLEDWDRVMIVNARGPSYATIVIHHAETYTLNV